MSEILRLTHLTGISLNWDNRGLDDRTHLTGIPVKGCCRILHEESARMEHFPFSVDISCRIVCANCSQMVPFAFQVRKQPLGVFLLVICNGFYWIKPWKSAILTKSDQFWSARGGHHDLAPKDPRQQSTKVEKSKIQYLSFTKHKTLSQNSSWVKRYVENNFGIFLL